MRNFLREWLGINTNAEALQLLSAKLECDCAENTEAIADIQEQIAELCLIIDPPPPEEPPVLPFYIKYMRANHPDKSDEELSEAVWLECQTLTHFYEPIYQDAAKTHWHDNDDGWPFVQPAQKKDDHEIHAGQEVLVYRWAFPADGGTVREVVYSIDGLKRLINIKAFDQP